MHFKNAVKRLTAGLMVITSLIVPALAATGTVDSGNSTLNMRASASTSGKVVAKLRNGTQVEVTGQAENGWYPVVHEGMTGFVSADFLVVTEDASAPAEAAASAEEVPAAESDAVYGRITASVLNVRSAPDAASEKVSTVSAGRVVEILETLDGWYRIEKGYISAEFVTIVDASEAVAAGKGAEIANLALTFVGCRYVYGGSSPKGFDCSGFTYYVLKQFGITLNRTASDQLDNGTPVSMSELQPGDLVMFQKNRNSSRRASHVGIYIGDGQFVHASTSSVGVIVSKMSSAYYTTGFVGGRRMV